MVRVRGGSWHDVALPFQTNILHTSLAPLAALCRTGGLYVVEQLMLIAESDPR